MGKNATTLKPGDPKRTHILSVARSQISQYGSTAFNMKQLAEEAQVPRPTLYRYYSSKEFLFSDLALIWGNDLIQRLEAKPIKGKTAGQRISGVFKSILNEAADHPKLIQVVLDSLLSSNQEVVELQDDLSALLPLTLSTSLDLKKVRIKKSIMDLLLRLLLANLQLLSSGRASFKESADSMTLGSKLLLGEELWQQNV